MAHACCARVFFLGKEAARVDKKKWLSQLTNSQSVSWMYCAQTPPSVKIGEKIDGHFWREKNPSFKY